MGGIDFGLYNAGLFFSGGSVSVHQVLGRFLSERDRFLKSGHWVTFTTLYLFIFGTWKEHQPLLNFQHVFLKTWGFSPRSKSSFR